MRKSIVEKYRAEAIAQLHEEACRGVREAERELSLAKDKYRELMNLFRRIIYIRGSRWTEVSKRCLKVGQLYFIRQITGPYRCKKTPREPAIAEWDGFGWRTKVGFLGSGGAKDNKVQVWR